MKEREGRNSRGTKFYSSFTNMPLKGATLTFYSNVSTKTSVTMSTVTRALPIHTNTLMQSPL